MNLKYPKLKSGLNLVYASVWVGLAGKMFSKAFVYAESILGMPLFGEWAEIIAAFVASIMLIIGMYKASKEVNNYRKVFAVAATELVLSFVYVLSSAFESLLLIVCTGVIYMAVALARMWLLCETTANVLKEEGEEKLAQRSKWIGICYSIVYGYTILTLLLTLVDAAGMMVVVTLLVPIATIAGWILYITYLHRATEFFEELKVEEQEVPEESANEK